MSGRQFWKMSGSGNDFIFFDAMHEAAGRLATPESIHRLCERRTGIGADGVVFLEPHPEGAFFMRYFNRDGSLAEMCGNAALCSTRLAHELGIVHGGDVAFETVSGPVTGRISESTPEIDMVSVAELDPNYAVPSEPGETRIGFARVGVPHLVVLAEDLSTVDVEGRGRKLRYLDTLRDGANVNFVSRARDGQWRIRTYERGVEEETLACGTGAVAATAMLSLWGLVPRAASLETRSGQILAVRVPALDAADPPVLSGEGRIVFSGTLGEI